MSKKGILTYRFCFGTLDNPGSQVWRLNANLKRGDIYLHNVPQSGNETHIALHSSGNFSIKLGRDRHKLRPPFPSGGVYWGPAMIFQTWRRRIPPGPPSGDIEKISWLGWPMENSLFIIKLVYVPKNSEWVRHDDDRLVFADIPAKLFHTEMSVHLLLQEREMTAAEFEVSKVQQVVDFGRPRPEFAEMIRISNTELGPSTIIHEPFEIP